MTTVRDIIFRAGRKIGMADMNADEASAGLDAFNDMVQGWKLDGIDVWHLNALNDGFPMVDAPMSDFTFASLFPMPDAFREGATFCLASRMAPEYGLAFDADDFVRKVQAHYATIVPAAMNDALIGRRW
jgi:hypothetical protein